MIKERSGNGTHIPSVSSSNVRNSMDHPVDNSFSGLQTDDNFGNRTEIEEFTSTLGQWRALISTLVIFSLLLGRAR